MDEEQLPLVAQSDEASGPIEAHEDDVLVIELRMKVLPRADQTMAEAKHQLLKELASSLAGENSSIMEDFGADPDDDEPEAWGGYDGAFITKIEARADVPEPEAEQAEASRNVECASCGEPAFLTEAEVAHHYDEDSSDLIDHDADADHVALPTAEPSRLPTPLIGSRP